MILKHFLNFSEFADRTLSYLYKYEAQNNLLIKNIENGAKGGDTAGWFYATVESDTACSDAPVMIALCTPPYSMILFAPDNAASPDAMRIIADECPDIPGIIAEHSTADTYISVCGRDIRRRFDMNVLVLTELADIDIIGGVIRKYNESDLGYLPLWTRNFVIDCGLEDRIGSEDEIRQRLAERIGMDEHYVFERDGVPVSMAKAGRKMEHGIVMNNVYTPPEERGKGYCQSLMYRLSEKMLADGNKFCCLFADALNPVSNHVYRKIGYRDLCGYSDIKFI